MSDTEIIIEKVFESGDAVADVIFVHGLTGDPVATWSTPGGEFWPTWLGRAKPHVNIWTVGYTAPLLAKFVKNGMTLFERGKSVLNALSVHGLGERPVCFVAHSLGGIVVKQTLNTAHLNEKADWKRLLQNTCSVTFLGTPHTGAGLASVLKFILPRASSKDIDLLSNESGQLSELNEAYRLLSNRHHLNTHVFYETYKTAKVGLIVSKESADCGIAGVPTIPVEADHAGICKPKNKNSLIFLSVRKIIKEDLDRFDALLKKTAKQTIPADSATKRKSKKRRAKARKKNPAPTPVSNHPPRESQGQSRVVFEKLAERGSIDLRKLGSEPYVTEYDPESLGSNAADVYFAVPTVSHVIGSKRHDQMPAICLCMKNDGSSAQRSLVDEDIREKLRTVSMARLFNEDKQRIVKSLHQNVHNGFIAGVTVPIRLFDAKRPQKRIHKTYDAMINSLASPIARLHAKLEFDRINFNIMPLGQEDTQTKLTGVVQNRLRSSSIETTARPVGEHDSRGMVELMKFLAWCYGHASNTGKMYWLDQIAKEGAEHITE